MNKGLLSILTPFIDKGRIDRPPCGLLVTFNAFVEPTLLTPTL